VVLCCGDDSCVWILVGGLCPNVLDLLGLFDGKGLCDEGLFDNDPSLQGLLMEQCFNINSLLFRPIMDGPSLLMGLKLCDKLEAFVRIIARSRAVVVLSVIPQSLGLLVIILFGPPGSVMLADQCKHCHAIKLTVYVNISSVYLHYTSCI